MNIRIEPDTQPRDTAWHRKIVSFKPIQRTRSGNWLKLECGHIVQSFGSLAHAEGRVLCTQCRDAASGRL